MSDEWERTKEMMKHIETEPDRPLKGATPGYQLLIDARFAKALRLIMEKLEEMG